MRDSEIRRKRKLLFTVHLALNNGLRQEGVGGQYVPDIYLNDRVSDWLASHFASEDVRLDQKNDIAVSTGEDEWRIVNWPMREYAYQVVRQRQTLCIYGVERPHLRVLALDAGGIAGYFNARLLQKIDDCLRQKVNRFKQAFHAFKSRFPLETQEGLGQLEAYINGLQSNFLDDVDYLMGTSAGSVNAAILAQADKPTTQLDRCIQVWREPRLFDNEPLSNLLAIYGLRSFVSFTKYKKSLSKYIPADLPLKDLKKDVLLTTYALDPRDDSPRSKPKIFNSAMPRDEDEFTLDVVLRSGSAAPLGAIHQGYADGGWYSASPSSHILPLFRWFTGMVTEEQQMLRDPLEKALERYLFVDEVWTRLYPGMTLNDRSGYLPLVELLNTGKMPEALRIKFFANRPKYDLRDQTEVKLREAGHSNATPVFECGDTTYTLHIRSAGALSTVELQVQKKPLYPRDVDGNLIKLTRAEIEQLLVELREEKLPACLQKAYFGESPVIDFATQPVGIQTESPHYRWRVERIVSDEKLGDEAVWKFRVTATTGEGVDDLISLERLSYTPDTKKLKQWLHTASVGNAAGKESIWALFNMYENMCEKNPKEAVNYWKTVQYHALNFLIRQMEPATKLSLLSVGVGIKNKRLVMPKTDYHWGYLHLMMPSPLNQFFSLGSAMASAQADRATEEINELAQLADELNFHRIDPGVLSLNRFAYSALAINPYLKDTAIAMLENDLSKLEVKDDVERTAEWLFRFWVLGDEMYQALTDGSSDRADFPTSVKSKSNMPISLLVLLPDREEVLSELPNHGMTLN